MTSKGVIPETPDRQLRRSSRRSTIISTLASGERSECITRIRETPDKEKRGEGADVPEKRVVEESPLRAGEATFEDKTPGSLIPPKRQGCGSRFFPMKRSPTLGSERTFVKYVSGTQDLASTYIATPPRVDKVRLWLLEGDEKASPTSIRHRKSPKPCSSSRNSLSDVGTPPSSSLHLIPSRKDDIYNYSTESAKALLLEFEEKRRQILEGVNAFVDVFEDHFEGVAEELKSLGAFVSSTFSSKVTHLVFKDGSLARYNKAKKMKISIVSVGWIEASKNAGQRLPEEEYPSTSKEKYDSPTSAMFIKRQTSKKRIHSVDTEKKFKRYVAMSKRRRERQEAAAAASVVSPPRELVPLDYYNSPNFNVPRSTKSPRKKTFLDQILESDDAVVSLPKTPSSDRRRNLSRDSPSCGSPGGMSDDYETPLSLRVAKQYYANRSHSLNNERLETVARSPVPRHLEESISLNKESSTLKENEFLNPSVLGENSKVFKRKRDSPNVKPVPKKTEAPDDVKFSKPRIKRYLLYSQSQELLAETPSPPQKTEIKNVLSPPNLKYTGIGDEEAKKLYKDCEIQVNRKSARYGKADNSRPSRRSSIDFVRRMTAYDKRRELIHKGQNEVVCSSCSQEELELIRQIIPKFGLYLGKSVTSKTTHVICCSEITTRRTLNVLRGLLRGCWIVSKEWIFTSLEEGYLVDEEPYERVDFSSAVLSCRMERIAFGSYRSELLKEVGAIYVSRKSKFSSKELGELVRLGGGKLACSAKKAQVVIGDRFQDIINVKESWLLDSIQHNVVMPFDEYLLGSESNYIMPPLV